MSAQVRKFPGAESSRPESRPCSEKRHAIERLVNELEQFRKDLYSQAHLPKPLRSEFSFAPLTVPTQRERLRKTVQQLSPQDRNHLHLLLWLMDGNQ